MYSAFSKPKQPATPLISWPLLLPGSTQLPHPSAQEQLFVEILPMLLQQSDLGEHWVALKALSQLHIGKSTVNVTLLTRGEAHSKSSLLTLRLRVSQTVGSSRPTA